MSINASAFAPGRCFVDELLDELPAEQRSAVAATLREHRVDAGDLLLEKGGPVATIYEIVEGAVESLDGDGVVCTFGPGEVIAFSVALSGENCPMAYRAQTICQVRGISIDPFKGYLESHPNTRKYFTTIATSAAARRLRGTLLRHRVPADVIRWFVQELETRDVRAGEQIVRQGARFTALWVVESGRFVVRQERSGESLLSVVLQPGELLGAAELDGGAESPYGCTAETDGRLLLLTAEKLEIAARSSPELRAFLQSFDARSGETDTPQTQPPVEDEETAPIELFLKDETPRAYKWRRPRFLRQHDEMDCGAACLAMVAHTYGRRIGVATYRTLIHVTREGASMWSLLRAAMRTGFEATGVMLEYEHLDGVHLPAIVLIEYHFAVVYRVTPTRVLLGDPAIGLHTLTREAFLERWHGVALLLRPTPAFFQMAQSVPSYRKYGQLLNGGRRVLAECLLASALLLALGLVGPLLTQIAFDRVLVTGSTSLLKALTIGMVTVAVFNVILLAVRTYLLGHFANRFDTVFSTLIYKRVLDLPLNFFSVRRTGDIQRRLAEVTRIRRLFAGHSLAALIDVVAIFIYLGCLFVYSRALGLVVLLAVPVVLAASLLMTRQMRRLHAAAFAQSARTSGQVIEQVRALETLKAMNAELPSRWRFEEAFRRELRTGVRLRQMQIVLGAASGGLRQLANIAVLACGVWLALGGALTVGQVIAATQFASLVLFPIERLARQWMELQGTAVAFERIDDVITQLPERRPSFEAAAASGVSPSALRPELPRLRGRIEFRNVWFRYGSEASPWVLKDLSFRIREGETVALVGRSGSGKTTLAQVMNLLLVPTRGTVLLDGWEALDLPLDYLRASVGMVMQDGHLFAGTILENITYGDPQPAFERAAAAARAADAYRFILRLPGGFDAELGENGAGLSAGQKQRLSIARALYRDPSILVLDEATSNLDAESENAVVAGTRVFCSGRTAVVIAHRLSTILHADRVFMLEAGRVIASGTHRELLFRCGAYARLFGTQLVL